MKTSRVGRGGLRLRLRRRRVAERKIRSLVGRSCGDDMCSACIAALRVCPAGSRTDSHGVLTTPDSTASLRASPFRRLKLPARSASCELSKNASLLQGLALQRVGHHRRRRLEMAQPVPLEAEIADHLSVAYMKTVILSPHSGLYPSALRSWDPAREIPGRCCHPGSPLIQFRNPSREYLPNLGECADHASHFLFRIVQRQRALGRRRNAQAIHARWYSDVRTNSDPS